MKVIAIEIIAAVRRTRGALAATARRPLTTAPASCTILHQDQPRFVRLASAVDGSRDSPRREWRDRRRHRVDCEHQGGGNKQCGSGVHFSAPDTWLEAP